MLGIIGAMESEIEALRGQMLTPKETAVAGMRFYEGLLFSRPVVLARAGVGKVHAAMCAQVMIERFHPDLILNIGVAGALVKDLSIGDIVVAQNAVQHDMDTSPIGDPKGMISGPDIVYMPCDGQTTADLERAAESIGLTVKRAAVATGDQFVDKAEKKAEIANEFGAAACDMEGGAIAQVCLENNVPYAAYRAISDTVNGNGLEYQVNVSVAAKKSAALLKAYLQKN